MISKSVRFSISPSQAIGGLRRLRIELIYGPAIVLLLRVVVHWDDVPWTGMIHACVIYCMLPSGTLNQINNNNVPKVMILDNTY